jgi:hypothetical protein
MELYLKNSKLDQIKQFYHCRGCGGESNDSGIVVEMVIFVQEMMERQWWKASW